MTMHLVGAGGTGSLLAPHLVRYMSHQPHTDALMIWDPDEVEPRNLVRQAFSEPQVGWNKAIATAHNLRTDTANVLVVPMPTALTWQHAHESIADKDVVFLCVDNFPTRMMVSRWVQGLPNTTLVNGGNELHHGTAQIYIRRNDVNITPPIEFLHAEIGQPDAPSRQDLDCMAAHDGNMDMEQSAVANFLSAAWMYSIFTDAMTREIDYHEVAWDTHFGATFADYRASEGWR